MKKSLRISALLLAVVMSMGACGGGGKAAAPAAEKPAADAPAAEKPAADAPAAEAPAAEAPADDAAAAEAAPAAANEIIFTSWANTGEIAVLSKAVDAYNTLQSNVKVTFRNAPGDGYEEQLITQLAGGVGPDVFYAGEGTVAKVIQNGTAADLTDFMATDASYCKVEDFSAGLWGGARTKDNKVFGISVDCNPTLLYYSPAKFKELGIEDPRVAYDAGTWNFDTFDKTLDALTAKGMKGFILGADGFWQYTMILNYGGTVWKDGVYKYDAKAIEAVKWMAERFKTDKLIAESSLPKGQGADASFISGQVGFVAAGRWHTPTFHTSKLDFDYIPFPNNTGNKASESWIATAYACVNNNSKNIEEAKKFATYYCSKDGQSVRLGGVGNAIPSINGIDNIVTDSKVPAHVADIFAVRDNGWANGGDKIMDGKLAGMGDDVKALFEEIYINNASVDDTIPQIEALGAQYVADNQ